MDRFYFERLPNSLVYAFERGPNWGGAVAATWNGSGYDLHFVAWPHPTEDVSTALYKWLESNEVL